MTFSSKNISIYAIFDDQNFNDTLTNHIVNFEQLGPGPFEFEIKGVNCIYLLQHSLSTETVIHCCCWHSLQRIQFNA